MLKRVALCLVAGLATVLACATSPIETTPVLLGGYWWKSSLTIDSVTKTVSGTNVEFTARVTTCGPTAPADTRQVVLGVCLMIGDQFVKPVSPKPDWIWTLDTGPTSFSKTIRFATTKFPNGPVTVTLDAMVGTKDIRADLATTQFLLSSPASGSLDWGPGTLPTLTGTYNVYNHSLCFATQIGGPAAYGLLSGADDAKHAADGAITRLTSALLHHTEDHGNTDVDAVTKDTLAAKLKLATVFVASTHGDSSGYYDSLSNSDPTHFMNWSANSSWVGLKDSTQSPYNAVMLDACNVLTPDPAVPAQAFGITSSSVDRCLMGFNVTVDAFLWPGSTADKTVTLLDETTYPTANLYEHLLAIFDGCDASSTHYPGVLEGAPLKEALDRANLYWAPRYNLSGWTWRACNMQLVGDNYTRLYYVYLTSAERATLTDTEKSNWYYIH